MVSQGPKGFYSIFFDAFMRQDLRFLFTNLRKYCDALSLDSRILFAHLGVDILVGHCETFLVNGLAMSIFATFGEEPRIFIDGGVVYS